MSSYPARAFCSSRECFSSLVEALSGAETGELDAASLESFLHSRASELMQRLLQDYLDLRAEREAESIAPMRAADGVVRSEVRTSSRKLGTLFGEVTVTRKTLVKRGCTGGLRPADAELNLPRSTYSFGVARHLAYGVAESSYTTALENLRRTSAAAIARRQAEELVAHTVQDFEDFYLEQPPLPANDDDLLVLSFDGSGVVMRPEALREETRKLAEKDRPRSLPETAASCGRRSVRKNRKRMAEVAAIYDIAPHPRRPRDILAPLRGKGTAPTRPRPTNKRVWASLKRKPLDVIDEAFVCANQRDPEHRRRCVVLLDGNAHQISAVQRMAANAGFEVTVVIDFLHVLGYLWSAGKALVGPDPAAVEAWVEQQSLRLLQGKVRRVVRDIRTTARTKTLTDAAHKAVETSADYLLNHQKMMRYNLYLRDGLPIATGVIEGACRSLVKDRMDITGARWGLKGAEAVLQLRSLRASGDLEQYLAFHQTRELERNHLKLFDENELSDLRDSIDNHHWERVAA